MHVAVSLVAGREVRALELAGFPRSARPVAVVVDVLRATSTLTVAFANGARAVEPFADPAAALARREAAPGDVLACGERGGRIVPGFDLGNSPAEYTRDRVAGKTLAFASTNGAPALLGCAAAGCRQRFLGAFVNAAALLREVRATRSAHVLVACAGKEGGFSLEDAAFAGWLCTALQADGATLAGAAARLATTLAPATPDEAATLVANTDHARWLTALGEEHAADVTFCGTMDQLDAAFAV